MGLPCLGEAEHEPGHNPLQPRLPRQAYRHRAAEDAPQAELSACFSSSSRAVCAPPHLTAGRPSHARGRVPSQPAAQHSTRQLAPFTAHKFLPSHLSPVAHLADATRVVPRLCLVPQQCYGTNHFKLDSGFGFQHLKGQSPYQHFPTSPNVTVIYVLD